MVTCPMVNIIMKLITFIFRFFLIFGATSRIMTFASPLYGEEFDEFNMSTVQIIEKYGYPVETHTTESEDGYILQAHRIPHGKNSIKIGIPILVAHGLLTDSSIFVLYGKNSLGLFLADEGYDVWLINMRGNYYTRAHKYLSSEDSEFWDFSWHEYGVYDVPAYIDYICKYTGHKDIFFIGYSMGSTAFFVMASEKPEYEKKIKGAVLLGPVAELKYVKSSLRILIPFRNFLRYLADMHLLNVIMKQTPTYLFLIRAFCNSTVISRQFCLNVLFQIVGEDPDGTDERAVMNFFGHASDASAKTLIHYLQVAGFGRFRQYDYGPQKNLIKYGQSSPPDYNLWSITTPMYLFVAPNDFLAAAEDVMETLAPLPSVKDVYFIPYKLFNHIDLLIHKDVKEMVHYETARCLNDITNNEMLSGECNSDDCSP